MIAIIISLLVAWHFVARRRLAQIFIYIICGQEPFPVIPRSHRQEKFTYAVAVRTLAPNTKDRIAEFLSSSETRKRAIPPHQDSQIILTAKDPRDLAEIDTEQALKKTSLYTTNELQRSKLAADIWPIARLVVDRILYAPRHEDPAYSTGEINADIETSSDLIRKPRNQIYFSYKMHMPQIAIYFILVAAILSTVAIVPDASNSQYPSVFAGLVILWGLISIWLYRLQHKTLQNWLFKWGEKPFAESPVFLFTETGGPNFAWEELSNKDFQTDIQQFGIAGRALIDFMFAILLLGFFGLLEVIK